MQPVLQNKDIILVESIKDLASLKKFDVIIFWQNNILVCHYFWKENKFFQSESLDLNSKIIVTRPLNPLKGYDHPIKMEQILGLVSQAKINWWLRLRIVLNF
ncbi:MAG: hypothetical protein Q7U04_16640 [Bacteriovorax sp.]|nr:hypothetical protein [Bacteriovorax sp.]